MESNTSNNTAPTAPSKVLHVRNLSWETEAYDLRQFVAQFGQVDYVVMLPRFQQALIEMNQISQAQEVIQYTQTHPINIKQREVLFNFSKSQEIKRNNQPATATPAQNQGEHILLLTIVNPLYNIDVSVLHSILSPYGNVLRIVIFHKNGTQALCEFDSPGSAVRARQNLDGKDIYDGCCTLRITYSRIEKLNVKCNNEKTRDYTNNALPTQLPSADSSFGGGMMQTPSSYQQPVFAPNGYQAGVPQQQMSAQPGPNAVLMVYNLPTTNLSCDRIFNLFCLYGNVAKIRLLPNKEGSAMVQMFDKIQADQACNLLHGVTLGDKELALTHSKHPYISDNRAVPATETNVEADDDSADSNPACKDYTQSPCNRFKYNMSYKHIYAPSKVVFFSNLNQATTEEGLTELLTSLDVECPTGMKFFETSQSPKRNGLMQFESIEAAATAIFVANNRRVDGHTIKFAFSNNTLS